MVTSRVYVRVNEAEIGVVLNECGAAAAVQLFGDEIKRLSGAHHAVAPHRRVTRHV